MRLIRALAALTVAGASLLVLPVTAAADAGQLTLTLTQRWQSSQVGFWTPYVAAVRNEGATDFTGDVFLSPVDSPRQPAAGWPTYRAHLVVPHGSERSATLYVVEAPSGYQATLRDAAGHDLVTNQAPAGIATASYAMAVLSDQPQASEKIEALRPLSDTAGYQGGASGMHVSRFASAQAFPTNAVYLAGLDALVVDDFDATTLSDAQVRALRDFVELGGSLVVAGGSAWRRTLLPLADHELGVLKPIRTEQTPLQPLADLVSRNTDLSVAAGVGELKGGTVVLGGAGGPPLAVEAALGAGKILDLAFDPLDQAFTGDDTGMAALAWMFTVDRTLLSATPAGNHGFQTGVGPGIPRGVPVNVGLGGVNQIENVLSDTPLAQPPPVGLLGGLLVFYVLLAGPVNYVVARAFRRGELMWLTVPALALLFTGAAYASGTVARGSNYFDNDVQVLRVAPDGAVEVHGYHAVFPPHRGDFTLGLPANTLGSTVLGSLSANSGMTAQVDSGSQTLIEMKNSPIGAPRTLQTLSVTHPPATPAIGVEAHLRLVGGRVQGTVKNTGERPLENLYLVSGTGQLSLLAAQLPPRATATIDSSYLEPGTANGGRVLQPASVGGPTDYKKQTVLQIAEGQAVTGRQGDLAIVATTGAGTEVSIAGATPAHSGIGGMIQPVSWDAADSLSGVAPRAELVMTTPTAPFHKDVFDLPLSSGFNGKQVKLTFFAPIAQKPAAPNLPASTGVRSIEVYDWTAGTWRALNLPQTASVTTQSLALNPGDYANGIVRVRVDEVAPAQSFMNSLQLADR